MVSTKSSNVGLWVWDRASRRMKQLTERGVALIPNDRNFVWISPRQILVPMLPVGEKPSWMSVEMRAAQKAQLAWPNTWTGKATAVSVLQSGVGEDLANRPQGALLIIDVETGESRTVATGLIDNFLLSP